MSVLHSTEANPKICTLQAILTHKNVVSFEIFAHKSVIEINFVTSEKYKMITSDGYDAASIIKNISINGMSLDCVMKYKSLSLV